MCTQMNYSLHVSGGCDPGGFVSYRCSLGGYATPPESRSKEFRSAGHSD